MNYKEFTNNAFNMTSKALKAVKHDIETVASDIATTRADIRNDVTEYSGDSEMLKESLKDHARGLEAYEHMLLDIKTDIGEIMDFLESIYCDE